MAKILVSRLSAMGDVAMLIPILYGVARANPEHEFTLLTQPFFANLLLVPPSNVEAMVIDIKGEERQIWGLGRYIERLRAEHFDLYIDAHDVIRTKLIRWSLGLQGSKVSHLRKPRRERKQLLKHKNVLLPPMQSLYEDCFRRVGLRIPSSYSAIRLDENPIAEILIQRFPDVFSGMPVVGVAPFASTESKTCKVETIEAVVRSLSNRGYPVYLFGARGKEANVLNSWAEKYPKVYSLAGALDLSDELLIMSKLRVMISMDSANMHFASMFGVPVVSVWCATHPSAGFLGMGQKPEDCVQDEMLDCRPCSIFGQMKKCVYGTMPCRESVTSEQIVRKVFKYIESDIGNEVKNK